MKNYQVKYDAVRNKFINYGGKIMEFELTIILSENVEINSFEVRKMRWSSLVYVERFG
jgi:hypothetical protein